MRLGCGLLLLAAIAAAQGQKSGDNCAPPPAAIAPSLPAKLLPGMGEVHLAITTTSPEAQKFFDQGLAQMNSFWAREAERSFLQAAELDPAAPMPHWGVAMVAAGDWRPRFQIDFLSEAFGRSIPPSMTRAREAAKKAALSARTLNRAKKALHIRCRRRHRDGRPVSYWLLPEQELPDDPSDCPELDRLFADMEKQYPPRTPLDEDDFDSDGRQ